MYEYYRYMRNPYLHESLQEYLDKGRKNHVFYGRKYSIKNDGFYNEYMEFGKHNKAGSRRDADRYIEYRILKEIDDPNAWLKCYLNINNPDEYMVVMCCKIGSKRSKKVEKIFTVLKEDR